MINYYIVYIHYVHTYNIHDIHNCVHTYIYVRMYIQCIYVHGMRMYIHTYIYSYIHTYTHTYVHNMYIHMYSYTCMQHSNMILRIYMYFSIMIYEWAHHVKLATGYFIPLCSKLLHFF